MKKTLMITLCILLSLFLGTASAVEVPLFGPNQYLRTTGSPNVYTDTFSGVPGEGKLIVKNGSWDGSGRITDAISSASIVVNGQEIFGTNDFNQQVYLLEAPVTLAENNEITVELNSNPGSYVTIQVTEEVDPPTVTIGADPAAIQVGESTTLSWDSTNANSCLIEPGIGSVDVTGSTTVSPNDTTTYTITATGLGGTATATVTVTVIHPPTASISADPEEILFGESSTLSWTSTHADTCVIQPDVGPVDPSGSAAVSPTETTTYTITATGLGGTATDTVTVTVSSPISVQITSPSDGDSITRPDVTVEGTITNAAGIETGVTVNGTAAVVYFDRFVANHIPLEEGVNTITATVTDTAGNAVTTSITVNAEITGDYIRITERPQSGLSPFETTLRIGGSFSFDQSSLTHTGPGVVEVLENPSPEEYRVRMTTEGIYYLTGEVTDTQSITYTDTAVVVVLNQAELDALLTAKWNGMRAALSGGSIGEAIDYISEGNREMYEYNFNLMSSYLPAISAGLQNLEMVQVKDGMAEYRMWADQDGQMYSFYILFVKDLNGIWRIEFF